MNQSRRKFIKTTSIASFSLLPVANILAKSIDSEETESEIEKKLVAAFTRKPDFHFIDTNLINLHFYFINIKLSKNYLVRENDGKSFVIVRLPQMHLSEQGFFLEEDDNTINSKQAEAKLSGYSFLAFELNEKGNQSKHEKLLDFNIRYLLDWNNKNLKLITVLDWLNLKEKKELDFVSKACIRNKKFISKVELNGESPNYYTIDEYKKDYIFNDIENFNNYQKLISKFLDNNLAINPKSKSFIPITLLEAPEGICLMPVIRDNEGLKKVKFNRNILTKDYVRKNGIKKYEIWNNGFLIKKDIDEQPSINVSSDFISLLSKNKTFETELPSFRIAGIIIDENEKHNIISTSDDGCDEFNVIDCENFCNEQKGENFLPSLLDKLELTFLTQYANDIKSNDENRDFQQPEFDIKEQNGLLFTGLGLITHLKYDNLDKLPDEVDLIEYEHKITQGRDLYVKVARLGYNSQTGQRYKHIIEGKRKIKGSDSTSFMELKQYCEPIDIIIKYDDQESALKYYKTIDKNWLNNDKILEPISKFSEKCDFKRFPFRTLTVSSEEKIPIRCLKEKVQVQNVCTIQCLPWFWPVNESLTKSDQENINIDYNSYLHCEYEAEDWEGNIVKAKTPFVFIRKSFIHNLDDLKLKELYDNYFSLDSDEGNLTKRRKTFINLQKIAYTPLTSKGFESQPNVFKSEKEYLKNEIDKKEKNKVNKIETDFIETYFQIKSKQSINNSGVSLVNNKLVVFPQLLRSKVYLDHVQDITNEKIPSVIEYHEDYVEHGFKDYAEEKDEKGNTTGISGNGAQLILANTDAFILGIEEEANNKWQDIANALAKAKKFTGNLVASDSVFDTLSLTNLGASLPKELKDAYKKGEAIIDFTQTGAESLTKFDPRALLRGKLKNVCGLDLTQILDEFIPKDSGPLFEIKNKVNEIGSDVLNSEIYREIVGQLDNLKSELKVASELYENELANIEQVRINYNTAVNLLSKQIPNEEDLKNAIIKKFEKGKLTALKFIDTLKTDYTSNYISDFKNNFIDPFNAFLDAKITELTLVVQKNYDKVESLENQLNNLKNKINHEPDLIHKIDKILNLTSGVNGLKKTIKSYFFWSETNGAITVDIDKTKRTIKDAFLNPYLSNVAENNTGYYFNIDTLEISKSVEKFKHQDKSNTVELKLPENLNNIGKIQLKKRIDDINVLLVKNFNIEENNNFLKAKLQAFQAKLKALNKEHKDITYSIKEDYIKPLGLIRDKLILYIDNERYPQYKSYKDQINFIINSIDEIVSGLELLEQIDPSYYLTRYNELEKEISEIFSRVNNKFISKFNEVIGKVNSLIADYDKEYGRYIKLLNKYYELAGQDNLLQILKSQENLKKISNDFQPIVDAFLDDVKNEYPGLIENYEKYKRQLLDTEKKLLDLKSKYEAKLKELEKETKSSFDEKLAEFINNNRNNINRLREAERIYKLLISIKQKDVTYKWNNENFSDKKLGFISFHKQSSPNTQLLVDAKSTVYFKPNVFPPTVDRIETNAVNKFKNFKIGIFNSLFVDFNEISFSSGTNQSSKFDVKIKDVKFEGVLSFVQAFEQYFKTMDTGFIKSIEKDRVKLGYSLPIPAIKTPSFNFFNLSLNFAVQIFFDNRPIDFEFSLARKDSMFGLSVGIYAGFGYFSIKANPQDGIVELETALEGGAWAGINIGPIRGEVKLAFGFYFRKTPNSTMLAGYFIAQGRLSVWIIRANATIYLGVYSENGNIVGVGYAKLSIKVGFTKKSFSGSYKKVMKRSKGNNNAPAYKKIGEDLLKVGIIEPKDELVLENDFMRLVQKIIDDDPIKVCKPIKEGTWELFINTF